MIIILLLSSVQYTDRFYVLLYILYCLRNSKQYTIIVIIVIWVESWQTFFSNIRLYDTIIVTTLLTVIIITIITIIVNSVVLDGGVGVLLQYYSRSPFQLFLATALFVRLGRALGHVALRVFRAGGRAGRLGRVLVGIRRRHLGQPVGVRPGRYLWRFDGRPVAAAVAVVVVARVVVAGRGRVTGRRRYNYGRRDAPCWHSGHA